jgi:hypothetical protein
MLWHAGGVIGEPVPDPYPVPVAERDLPPGGELQPGIDQVLAALAEIWIRSDPSDNGARLLEQACPHLRLKRAAQAKAPVRVGPESATSVAAALLQASRSVTQTLRSAFGCGHLVDVVLSSYPRYAESDPWEFNWALLRWRAPEVLKDIVGKGCSARSEFFRRLLNRDIGAALSAVHIDALCLWLWQLFGGADWGLLRQDLVLEFEAVRPSCSDHATRPRWDKARRELWYGDKLCLEYKRPAPRQHLLLDAFEEMNWPDRIDDPLPPGTSANTIGDLQKRLRSNNSPVAIERDGSGTGFLWRGPSSI